MTYTPYDIDPPETAVQCDGCGKVKPIREVLDGDSLCQECCDQWAHDEGVAARIHEEEMAEERAANGQFGVGA